MKRVLSITLLLLTLAISGFAQEKPTVIKLDQTPGKFEKEGLTLKPGKYIFEVTNVGIDHEVGFVITPVVNGKEGEYVTESYLGKTIKNGEKSQSKVVELKAGTYNYFCPLNPTPHYKITVTDKK
uniref:cupredoxin domain-containing protein n=2 Tax=Roseivirga sp. TaxID=1964215 RepID=UPI0040474377